MLSRDIPWNREARQWQRKAQKREANAYLMGGIFGASMVVALTYAGKTPGPATNTDVPQK